MSDPMEILDGTTQQLVIKVPATVPVANITGIELTFTHKGEKTVYYQDSVTTDAEANTITYNFTEAETLALDPTAGLVWQIRMKSPSGSVGTKPKRIEVITLLSGEAMP